MDKNNQNKVPNDLMIKLILRPTNDSPERKILTISGRELGGDYIVDSIVERGHELSFKDTELIPAEESFRQELFTRLETILQASIVNAQQREALLTLIRGAFIDNVLYRQDIARRYAEDEANSEHKIVETSLGDIED